MSLPSIFRGIAAGFALFSPAGRFLPAAEGTAAPAAARLIVTVPTDYEIFQRDHERSGRLTIEGQWSVSDRTAPPPEGLELRLIPPDGRGGAPAPWQALPFNPRARGFRADIPALPGGWYRMQLRLTRGAEVVAEAEVPHVGLGEIFLIAGQSNAANYGEERQRPHSGLVANFDGTQWTLADDPQRGAGGTRGSFIPSFGDALASRLGVPVGVACLAVGSTSVREWLPKGTAMSAPPTTGAHCLAVAGGLVSAGDLFANLAARLRQFPAGGVRAVLWHQGESDWNQGEGFRIPLLEYREDLARVISRSRESAGWAVPWFVAQASYHHPADPGSAEFRAVQRSVSDGRLTFVGPDTDALGSPWREKAGQGVHFSAAGLQRHGELWANLVGDWIEHPLGR